MEEKKRNEINPTTNMSIMNLLDTVGLGRNFAHEFYPHFFSFIII